MDYSTLTVYSKRILKIHTTLAKLETEKIDSNVQLPVQTNLEFRLVLSINTL